MGGAGKDRAAGRNRRGRVAGGGGYDASSPTAASLTITQRERCAVVYGPWHSHTDAFGVTITHRYGFSNTANNLSVDYAFDPFLPGLHLPRSAVDPESSSESLAAER